MPVPVYRWALPENLEPLKSAILETVGGEFDVLLFTSAQQLRNVLEVADQLRLAGRLDCCRQSMSRRLDWPNRDENADGTRHWGDGWKRHRRKWGSSSNKFSRIGNDAYCRLAPHRSMMSGGGSSGHSTKQLRLHADPGVSIRSCQKFTTADSCGRHGGNRPTRRRFGSCGKRAGIFRSTWRSDADFPFSNSASVPIWRLRSLSTRSGSWASMQPSYSPISLRFWSRWGLNWITRRARQLQIPCGLRWTWIESARLMTST